MAILEAVETSGATTRTALGSATGLAQPTLNRIAANLVRHRLLDELPGGLLTLGLRLFELGTGASQRGINLVDAARPILLDLHSSTAATVQLAVLDEASVRYLVKIEHRGRLLATRVASRSPAHCTGAGKAMLAALAPEQLDRVVPLLELTARTPATITSLEALMADLRAVRRRGFAVDREEFQAGMTSVAAAVPTAAATYAAVTLSGAAVAPDRHGPLVRLAARALRSELDARRSTATEAR